MAAKKCTNKNCNANVKACKDKSCSAKGSHGHCANGHKVK